MSLCSLNKKLWQILSLQIALFFCVCGIESHLSPVSASAAASSPALLTKEALLRQLSANITFAHWSSLSAYERMKYEAGSKIVSTDPESYYQDESRRSFRRGVSDIIDEHLAPKDYADFLKTVDTICNTDPYLNMNDNKLAIIRLLARIPREDYETHVKTIQSLLHPATSALHVINCVLDLPSKYSSLLRPLTFLVQREQYAQQVGMWEEDYIVQVTDFTDILERLRTLHRSPVSADEEKVGGIYSRGIRALLMSRWTAIESVRNRILEVLETPLTQRLDARGADAAGNGAALYAQGVNIHSDDREKRTNKAYRLLLSLWNPSDAEIRKYFDQCKQYVKKSGSPSALSVLMGGTEGVAILGGFGSLLQGGGLVIQSNLVPPQVLLAHLWHFITETFAEVDPADVENAKRSFVRALEDAVDRGTVVCDPGKYQRIATAVLQARLEGVQIDTEIPIVDVKLVKVNPELLDSPRQSPQAVDREPVAIRNPKDIQTYLQPLIQKWNASGYPRSSQELFQQTFEYWNDLAQGRVPGTDGRNIILDPRDVVFYMIFGEGISREHPALATEYGLAGNYEELFDVQDYIALYQQQEKDAFEQARKLEDDRRLREEQDRAFAAAEAADRQKMQAKASQGAGVERDRQRDAREEEGGAALVRTPSPRDDAKEAELTPQQLREARLRFFEERGR